MSFTNQEKQERFRKKEYLKKISDEIFRDWQLLGWREFQKDPKTVKMELEKIADLPSGWNDADYEQALKAFQIFSDELYSGNPYLLQNDVYAGRDSVYAPMTSPDGVRLIREQKNAVWQAKKLVSHINSAMDLSGGIASDNAAVVMELARNTGLSLLKERITPKSKAAAICLLMTNPLQKKPDWLIDELAVILKEQLGEDGIKLLKEKL